MDWHLIQKPSPNRSDKLWTRETSWCWAGTLFSDEFHACKGRQLAALFVVNKPQPGVGSLVVGKCGVDAAAVRAPEHERDFITATFALGDGLRGETAAGCGIEPHAFILPCRFVPFDKDDGFIGGLTLGIFLARGF